MATVYQPVNQQIAGRILKVKELVAVSEVDHAYTKKEIHAQRQPETGYYIEEPVSEIAQ